MKIKSYLELKIELEEAIDCEESKSKVYELYQKFESAFMETRLEKRNARDRIDAYFKFLDYMNGVKK